jgi:Asp-tRNA(Asn)/Glu-tRNA(Gln) amidotransferase A subunit family amidase
MDEHRPSELNLVEASIPSLRHALTTGSITSVALVALYLRRIATYDTRGPTLNSIPLLSPSVFDDAAASDDRRAAGLPSRPLEGIPYTIKDSYKAAGLTVASGSPAFKDLVAMEDAFTVAKLREAGAILLGKTNMPPMAAGGMQRGVYGRAESPYNLSYLTSAFASGSSNGSATSTAASFAAFGMAEETVSSGRSPASNNGLVAYTPSRGVISIRGNWPLYLTCDVVVPHARCVGDLFEVLDVIVQGDAVARGDFWRWQSFIQIPDVETVRPRAYLELADKDALRGKRIAVPRMYIGKVDEGVKPVTTRQSVIALWESARKDLESLGAEIIETDFPLVSNYEKVTFPGQIAHVEGFPSGWNDIERGAMIALAWDDFLRANGDPACADLSSVDVAQICPPYAPNDVQVKYSEAKNAIRYAELVQHLRSTPSLLSLPGLEQALLALEAARKRDLEDWMDAQRLDLVVFPANGDIGRADADVDDESARHAWQNGVKYSNGNRALRHLGVPTVTVTMGLMADTGMPVGLTFAGRAYADNELLKCAYAFETASGRTLRQAPTLTPPLPSDSILLKKEPPPYGTTKPTLIIHKCEQRVTPGSDAINLEIAGSVTVDAGSTLEALDVSIDGESINNIQIHDGQWEVQSRVKNAAHYAAFKTAAIVTRDQIMVVVTARASTGRAVGKLILVD